jgi:beta-lactamase regulating signal transducer with metallopeptidase domain
MKPFPPEVIERLGWVLVHSVWQFAVVAIVAGMLVAVLRRRTATSRYAVLVTAMLLMVAVPCATWMIIPQPAAYEISDLKSQIEHTDTMETVPPLENSIDEVTLVSPNTVIAPPIYEEGDQTRRADAVPRAKSHTELVRPWFSWIVGGWLIGVLLCSLRPLLGWRMLRRLRRIGISPPSDDVLAAFTRVSQKLGLRRAVHVFHSSLATGPLVVGYLKPVVLLPVSLVSSIPLSQLEAILAHELAHIRRHDFIVNLFQTLMETLFFYHPAIWWLSRRIRIEREHCCDDLVVKLFNNGVDYGRALLAIEQLQSQGTILALGAADGSLLGRIRRILGHREPRMRSSLMMSAVATICFVMVFYGLIATTVFSKSDDPQTATAEISAIAVTALISDQLLAEIRHLDKSQTNSEIAKNIFVLKGNEIRRLLNSRKDDEDAIIGAGVAVLRSTDGYRSGLTQSVAATNILRINEQQVQMTAVGSVTYKFTAKD